MSGAENGDVDLFGVSALLPFELARAMSGGRCEWINELMNLSDSRRERRLRGTKGRPSLPVARCRDSPTAWMWYAFSEVLSGNDVICSSVAQAFGITLHAKYSLDPILMESHSSRRQIVSLGNTQLRIAEQNL